MSNMKNYYVTGLIGLCFVLFVSSLYLVFVYVPTEATMGITQRIFYYHVPVAWLGLLAFIIIFVGSILFLWKGDTRWDIVASSSAEIGFVFTTLVLITGSIWDKPAWGVWWVWEPRLTGALILWFIYIAYLVVRSYAIDEQRGARFAAVVGIVGFIDVPIVALATVIWRTQHPSPIIFEGGLEPPMLLTLLVSLAAFTLLFYLILKLRISLRSDEIELQQLKEQYQQLSNTS